MLLPLKYLNAYHKQALRKQTFLASAHWHCLTGMNLKSVFHIPKNLEFLHLSDNRRHQRQLSNLAQFSSVQLLSRFRFFAIPWIAAFQASLSITNSQSSLKLTSIKSVMHLILCCPLFLLPPIPPSIRVFSNESTLPMKWAKYWSFSFSIIPSKEHPGLISFRMD